LRDWRRRRPAAGQALRVPGRRPVPYAAHTSGRRPTRPIRSPSPSILLQPAFQSGDSPAGPLISSSFAVLTVNRQFELEIRCFLSWAPDQACPFCWDEICGSIRSNLHWGYQFVDVGHDGDFLMRGFYLDLVWQ